MRKVVFDTYECEVCGTHYETAAQALACEAAGRPAPRFADGAPVRIRPDACPAPLTGERFTVAASTVELAEPARAECEGGDGGPRHVVSYVLRNHTWKVGFLAEHQLQPDPGA